MKWWFVAYFLIAFGLAAIGAATFPSPAAPVQPLCSNSAQEIERARSLVQQGLEQALVEQTQHLSRTWSSSNIEESSRAAAGVRNAIRAYFHAREQIDSLKIPPCTK